VPQGVVAAAFANRELYLVLANFGRTTVDVATRDEYVSGVDPTARIGQNWQLTAAHFKF
jgi:hypothetical protein